MPWLARCCGGGDPPAGHLLRPPDPGPGHGRVRSTTTPVAWKSAPSPSTATPTAKVMPCWAVCPSLSTPSRCTGNRCARSRPARCCSPAPPLSPTTPTASALAPGACSSTPSFRTRCCAPTSSGLGPDLAKEGKDAARITAGLHPAPLAVLAAAHLCALRAAPTSVPAAVGSEAPDARGLSPVPGRNKVTIVVPPRQRSSSEIPTSPVETRVQGISRVRRFAGQTHNTAGCFDTTRPLHVQDPVLPVATLCVALLAVQRRPALRPRPHLKKPPPSRASR